MATPARFVASHFGGIPSTYSSVATDPTSSDISTADTVAIMSRYAREHASSNQVQEAIRRATSFLPANASASEVVEAIYEWVRNNVRFTEDEKVLAAVFGKGPEAELVLTPPRLLTMPVPMGDCDCISTLLASMLLGSGTDVGVSFVTAAVDDAEPGRFSHVYVSAALPCGQQVPLDASHGPKMGWEVENIYRKQVYEVSRPGKCEGKMIQGLGLSDFWQELIQAGAQTGQRIAESRYGVPPVGTYIQTKEGVVMRSTAGPTAGIFPPTILPGGGGDILKWLLIVGAVVAGIAILKR